VIAWLLALMVAVAGVGGQGTGTGDPELDEIERALAEDQAPPPPDLHDHADPHGGAHHLDLGTPDDAPTWDEFVDGWELFRDPIYAGGIAGLVLGFLSVFVVLRRMVFVSAAVTQAAGFGVAASFYAAARFGWSFDPLWGATMMSLLAAALVAPDPRRLGLSREMVLGLAFAFFSGAAVLASSKIPQEAHDVQAILFGTAVVVSRDDMHQLAIAGGLVLFLQLWWFRGFAFTSFDPLAARVQGLPVRLLDVLLLLCIGVMVGEAARALGALPAFALSVLPGVAAVQVARGPLIVSFIVAAVLGAACGAFGYIVAFFLELPVGATQTVLAALVVVVATILRAVADLFRSLRRR